MTGLPLAPDVRSSELEHQLGLVCCNEGVPTYRDFEELLFPVAQALLRGWQPDFSDFRGLPRQRAGYLVDLLAGWMPEAQARTWRPVLERLAADSVDRTPGPFFHGDPVSGPCEDEVARLWRLTRGLNVARLRQGLAEICQD